MNIIMWINQIKTDLKSEQVVQCPSITHPSHSYFSVQHTILCASNVMIMSYKFKFESDVQKIQLSS